MAPRHYGKVEEVAPSWLMHTYTCADPVPGLNHYVWDGPHKRNWINLDHVTSEEAHAEFKHGLGTFETFHALIDIEYWNLESMKEIVRTFMTHSSPKERSLSIRPNTVQAAMGKPGREIHIDLANCETIEVFVEEVSHLDPEIPIDLSLICKDRSARCVEAQIGAISRVLTREDSSLTLHQVVGYQYHWSVYETIATFLDMPRCDVKLLEFRGSLPDQPKDRCWFVNRLAKAIFNGAKLQQIVIQNYLDEPQRDALCRASLHALRVRFYCFVKGVLSKSPAAAFLRSDGDQACQRRIWRYLKPRGLTWREMGLNFQT